MSKTITRIIAEDGTEFDSQDDCDRHEEFQAAKDAFRKAVSDYDLVLAKQFKTGDGIPFTFQRSTYHYVFESSYGPRLLSHLSLYGYYCKVSEDGYVYRDKGSGPSNEPERFEIAQLFVSERAAHEKLLQLKLQQAQWLQDDINELRAKIETIRF